MVKMAEHKKPQQKKTWLLAHLSDPHLARTAGLGRRDLHGKRLLGWLRWHLKRRFMQDERLLTMLSRDLQQTGPDHIAITGDLSHLSLAAEFTAARAWLESLGDPARLSLVLGNHDQYVATEEAQSWALLLPWLRGDAQQAARQRPAELEALFPLVQQRGRIVLISLNTARPTALHLASGTIGASQLARLRQILHALQGQGLFRILLLHHPPGEGLLGRRRGLTGGAELRALLRNYGVELILCGHSHHCISTSLPGPSGIGGANSPIPLVSAPSITSIERRAEKRSRYFLIAIQEDERPPAADTGSSWTVTVRSRLLAPDGRSFIDAAKQQTLKAQAPAGLRAGTACAGG